MACPPSLQAAASGAVLLSLVPLLVDVQQLLASVQAGSKFGINEAVYLLTALAVKVFMRLALHAAVLVVARVVLGVAAEGGHSLRATAGAPRGVQLPNSSYSGRGVAAEGGY
jgi:hypothetical protein